MVATPLLGPYNVSRSKNFADNVLINLYPEISETRDAKGAGVLYMTPGLDLLATAGGGPVRGMGVLLGVLYVVSNKFVYSVTATYVVTQLGQIGSRMGPVSIIQNGTQLIIFDGSGSVGYLIENGKLSTVTLPFVGPVSATYQDGFGLVNELNTNIWWQSNLLDLSQWDALNFSSADARPDPIIAAKSIHREVWLIKVTESEIWIDAGLNGFAFQRLEGVMPEVGCAAAFSVCKAGESLIWLSQTSQGQGIVVMTQGYQANRISTHSIEFEIQQLTTISDAIAFTYEQEGHVFYVLTFPSGNLTLVYDVTASALAGIPMWHKRAAFLDGQFNRWWPNCAAFFNGQTIVGDYLTGNLYALNLDAPLDNGQQRKWVRSWRAVPQPSIQTRRFSCLTIDMQTGIGVPDGTNPQLVLDWSDDGGHNWSNEMFRSAGKTGETGLRIQFRRLGSTNRSHGLDRIFRLSSTDVFGTAIIGADIQ